jgi:outer membrane murein-binding lipoprotein Lpp
MLVLTALVVLAGVLGMLVVAGNILDQRLDDRVAGVQKQFDTSLERLRQDVRKELDARIPAGGVTPVPTVEASPTPSPEGEETVTPTPTPSASPGASATPTPDEGTP